MVYYFVLALDYSYAKFHHFIAFDILLNISTNSILEIKNKIWAIHLLTPFSSFFAWYLQAYTCTLLIQKLPFVLVNPTYL